MKQLLLICAVVALVGCGKKPAEGPEFLSLGGFAGEEYVSVEAAIRKAAGYPTGELTKADFGKVTRLDFQFNKLTDNKLTDVNGIAGKRHSEPSSNHVTFGSFLCVRLLMKPARCISREKRLRGRRQIKRVLPNIEAGTTIDRG